MFGSPVRAQSLSLVAFIALLILTLSNKLLSVRAQGECHIDCDEVDCLSDVVNQDSCPDGAFYQDDVVTCNCCPACVKFHTQNEYKMVESKGVTESQECAPGLKCEKNKCEINEGKCFAYQYQTVNILKHYCDADGTYSAVQCKGDNINGRCFCYNKDGSRLFGSKWWNKADNMTCACSREATLIKQMLLRTDVSLHCTLDGNYEQLQCDDHLCWCADLKTGVPMVEVVPETMMKLLPCYAEEPDKPLYLRECESIEIAANHIQDIARSHGYLIMDIIADRCDPDGSYGPVQILEREVRCTRTDKTMIGNWMGNLNDIKDVNCNCARDQEYYKEFGLDFIMECGPNGNYMELQSDGGDYTFCVDKDGFPTTDVGNFTQEDCPKW